MATEPLLFNLGRSIVLMEKTTTTTTSDYSSLDNTFSFVGSKP